ncbi:CDP-glycerol glycerophosphotransferase family protein [Staphylococcus kloosii]|uniref:CDP-glycerol glycerophosphotransferase family protein n=1 Tax=Staphylococcus kloosii TaxID=29384 RepID=UPI001E49CD6E|nr:CDP-glycerol glycerophosphotransferase family protein [Staphylococcus kloosii]MCD8879439.1 CDP-glycerol glycerophosphotransferase family protein [Staphylococcus kloosii]
MERKLLSIIVPIFNVQGYLHDCIDSLLEQNLDNSLYEIILINDGSIDLSGNIIDRYSEMYENVKVYHYANSGLGATRNKGINLAQGKYIAFLDSDDFVPKKAYSSLLESALYNDAEIVTSPVERFENNKYSRSGLHKKVDFTPKVGTTLKDTTSLLYDTTSTNKIYNLQFLKMNNLYFPEGIVYEDIYFTMRAYAKARKINIIDTVTYIWRIRKGETISISQDRFNIQGYKDRISTCLDALNFLREHTDNEISKNFERKILVFDLPLFFPEYQNTNVVYTKEFIKLTNEALKNLDSSLIKYCDYRKQAIYEAIKRKDVNLTLNYSQDHARTMILKKDSGLTPTDDYLPNSYINSIDFNNSEILKTKVIALFSNNKEFRINTNIESKLLEQVNTQYIHAYIFNNSSEMKIPINHLELNTYELIVDLDKVANFNEAGLNKIKLVYKHEDIYFEKILSEPGNKNTKLDKKTKSHHYKIDYSFGWDLFIKKEDIHTIFNNVYINQNKLFIDAYKIDEESVFQLKNYREQTVTGYVRNEQIVFDLTNIKNHDRLFELSVIKNGITTNNYKFNKIPKYFNFIKTNNQYEYVLRVYSNHSISINKKGIHSKIKSITHKNNTLLIEYTSPYRENNENIISNLIVRSTNGKVLKQFPSKKINEDLYRTEIDLASNDINYFLTYGTYLFSVDYYLNNKLLPESLLRNENKNVVFPFEFNYQNRKYAFSSHNGHLIYLKKSQILSRFDDTKKKRTNIYKYLYPLFRLIPKNKNKIVYYSYWGDQYSCSPRAIYKQLAQNNKKYKNIWIFNDINMPVEGNPIKVKKNSLKYWYHLATSKYFIQNTNMPLDYKKRNGQIELQTFHGTFMKTMGFDTPEFKFETRQYKIDEFQSKVDKWNYVSIPSDYMAEKAQSAFNTEVKPLKSGFPRNDLIFKALNHVDEIKNKLDIPKNKKVILYAPTWREGKSSDVNLDIDLMEEKLNDEYVLLVRAHYMVSNNMDIRKNYPFAINVSNYPSIEDLYAISDMLITDYSSVMFDYAYLKRPMLFYSYDLEKYLFGERGVYLNYENIVPGPVVRTTNEIISNINNSTTMKNNYNKIYDAFYNKFCQYGRNGDSANQVISDFIKN